MNPFYFGNSNEPLFGVYHQPRCMATLSKAILICPPLGREYLRTHWALRRLSDQLSRVGYHVLRFDYFATGDSAGSTGDVDVARCQQDIRAAATELLDISGENQISVVGLRAGAAIAASTEKLKIQDLVLWDSVINGCDYLHELEQLHQIKLQAYNNLRKKPLAETPDEVLGFPMPQSMRESIKDIDLLSGIQAQADNIYLFSSRELAVLSQLQHVIENSGSQFSAQIINDAGDWDNALSTGDAFLPNIILKAIVDKLGER